MAEIELRNVTAVVDRAVLLNDISVTLKQNQLTAIIGPNGAGKSSLLKAALGIIPVASGDVLLDQKPIGAVTPMERARLVSYLPQMRPLAWPISVRDAVALGRYAYGVDLNGLRGRDAEAVQEALTDCDLLGLADRRTDTLSGGELTRVHCARAFAAETPLLLADEPITALDPRHQLTVMSLVRRHADNGAGAAVVMHDILLAARFADRLIWMKDGAIHADGTPADTLTASRMLEIFEVRACIERTPQSGLAITLNNTV